jgi:hypothetical protein
MRAIRAFFRFIFRSIWLLMLVAAVAGGVGWGLSTMETEEGGFPFGFVVAGIAVIIIWRSFIRRGRVGRSKHTVTATVRRIWQDPVPGAPSRYWTFVQFHSRGKAIKIHLEPHQVARFMDTHSEGDTGRLTYRGDRMVAFDLPTPEKPLTSASGALAFVSYAHSGMEDAKYIAQFLQSRGLTVWLDQDQLHAGSRLSNEVTRALGEARWFVPMLSADYWGSPWCVREMETALDRQLRIIPMKVTDQPLVAPPHLREVLRRVLDDTVYVDLSGRNYLQQLDDVVTEMLSSH